jgi:hypothetical protein
VTYDPERLERQNDAEIDGISERAKHLKEARLALPRNAPVCASLTHCRPRRAAQVTINIQGEVEAHHRLLDQMARSCASQLLALAC